MSINTFEPDTDFHDDELDGGCKSFATFFIGVDPHANQDSQQHPVDVQACVA